MHERYQNGANLERFDFLHNSRGSLHRISKFEAALTFPRHRISRYAREKFNVSAVVQRLSRLGMLGFRHLFTIARSLALMRNHSIGFWGRFDVANLRSMRFFVDDSRLSKTSSLAERLKMHENKFEHKSTLFRLLLSRLIAQSCSTEFHSLRLQNIHAAMRAEPGSCDSLGHSARKRDTARKRRDKVNN